MALHRLTPPPKKKERRESALLYAAHDSVSPCCMYLHSGFHEISLFAAMLQVLLFSRHHNCLTVQFYSKYLHVAVIARLLLMVFAKQQRWPLAFLALSW